MYTDTGMYKFLSVYLNEIKKMQQNRKTKNITVRDPVTNKKIRLKMYGSVYEKYLLPILNGDYTVLKLFRKKDQRKILKYLRFYMYDNSSLYNLYRNSIKAQETFYTPKENQSFHMLKKCL